MTTKQILTTPSLLVARIFAMLQPRNITTLSSIAFVVVGAVISIASVVFMSPSAYAAGPCVKIQSDTKATYYADCAKTNEGKAMTRTAPVSGKSYTTGISTNGVSYHFDPKTNTTTEKSCIQSMPIPGAPSQAPQCTDNNISVTVDGRQLLSDPAEKNPSIGAGSGVGAGNTGGTSAGTGSGGAGSNCDAVILKEFCGEGGIGNLLKLGITIATAGVIFLAIGGIAYGAVLYATAGGADGIKKAKGIFINVAIGILMFAVMAGVLAWLSVSSEI